eukprot:COSAG04_NODE_455_length_14087_cov_4.673935_10_plen_237_part_00
MPDKHGDLATYFEAVPLMSYRCRDPRRARITRRNARVCRSSVGSISGLQLCLQACELKAGDFGHDRRDGGCDGGVEVLGLLLLGDKLFLRLQCELGLVPAGGVPYLVPLEAVGVDILVHEDAARNFLMVGIPARSWRRLCLGRAERKCRRPNRAPGRSLRREDRDTGRGRYSCWGASWLRLRLGSVTDGRQASLYAGMRNRRRLAAVVLKCTPVVALASRGKQTATHADAPASRAT